jgi:hypothetical protein
MKELVPTLTPTQLQRYAMHIAGAGGGRRGRAPIDSRRRTDQAQVAKAEKAISYPMFFQRFVTGMVRDVATTGRMI